KCGENIAVPPRAEGVMVASESARQPECARRTDRALELSLDVGLRELGIASRVELHGFCEHDPAGSIDLNAAALIHKVAVDERCAGGFGHDATDVLILVPACPALRAPAVEHEVHSTEPAVVAEHETWSDVAHPGV